MYSPCRYSKSPTIEKSPESSPSPRRESSPYSKRMYFSTFHPSLLRQRVLTPFGVGLCSRKAFQALAKRVTEDDRYKKSVSMPSLAMPLRSSCPPVQPSKADKSGITITSGACGRGFVVRSKASGLEQSINNDKKSLQNPRNMTFQEAKIAKDLSDLYVREDTLQDDIAAVRERLSLKHLTLLNVSECLSDKNRKGRMAAVAETLMEKRKAQPEVLVTSPVADAPNPLKRPDSLQEVPCCPRGALRLSGNIEGSLEKYRSTNSCRGAAWRREVRGKLCPSLSRPSNYPPEPETETTVSPTKPNSPDRESLKVGTSVRILAPPDVCQPSISAGQHRFIIAVVTYVTTDGRYKLGTTKGIIGRLFTREELQPRDRRILNASDIPRRSITVREASTLSFTSNQ